MKTLRLNFPQWQGGESRNIASYIPELSEQDASQGYYLSSRLVSWLVPKKPEQIEADVPVSLDYHDNATANGIFAYDANLRQQTAAMNIIRQHQPDKIITLGGDCAVSLAPFAWLADKYANDVAILWIDGHPDLGIPGDEYTGYHAMVLAQILGTGDSQMAALLPEHKVRHQDALIVGLRYFGEPAEQRRKDWGIQTVPCAQANSDSGAVLAWLKQTGKSKVLVHFDLDVLEASDLKIAVGHEPNGLHPAAAARLINDIAAHAEIVGLTIAEAMPREVIKLRNLLHSLPL